MTTSKFSFTGTPSTKSTGNTNNFGKQYNQSTYNLPGDAQYKFYSDLCKRKRVPVNPRSTFTKATISTVIDALQQQPDMISDAQLEKVMALYVDLDALSVKYKKFSTEELFTFSGGREGKASRYITHLLEKLGEAQRNAPCTEEQQQIMVPWMLCPAIPFESITIPREDGSKVVEILRSKATGRTHAWSSDAPVTVEWTMLTADEFAEQLASKLTKQDANYIIDNFRGIYYDWKKTRITKSQQNHVRKIEERMANMFVPKAVELAYDWETGEEIEIKTVDSHVSRGENQYVGYTPISELDLIQMSVEDASKYIDQLSYELECVKNGKMRLAEDGSLEHFYNPEDEINQDMQAFTEKHSAFNERNHTGNATSDSTKDLVEITAFNDMLFALEAIAGHQDETLHELAKPENIINESNELLEYVAEFMYNTIDFKREMAYTLQRLGGLMTIAESTVVGTRIAQHVSEIVTNELFAKN